MKCSRIQVPRFVIIEFREIMLVLIYFCSNGWFGSDEFLNLVKEFHKKYARFPPDDVMKPCKEYHTGLINKIMKYLREVSNIASRVEYTGSSYEGIKVMSSELEFDCMIVLKTSPHLMKTDDLAPAGYGKLRPKPGKESHFKQLTCDGLLSTNLVSQWFHGQLTTAVKDLGLDGDVLKLRYNGQAAIMLDVWIPGNPNDTWYTVDMVPTFEVTGPDGVKEAFVTKASENRPPEEHGKHFTTWRRSYSLEEKKKMNAIDHGNGCRRQCVRIMKVIKDRETALKSLPSYVIKTTLMNLTRDEPGLSWSQKDLGLRFIDMLEALQKYLEQGYLPHHFTADINVLNSYKETALFNMVTRIGKLLRSEKAMRDLLKTEQ